ncbi:MAG: transcription antiterminator [Lacrimispora sp.]|uniref:PRD domain-containing protein n=1 Tax=Lacrimispora sp. TaxID=2719234 RepID=UPI0039E31CC2
MQFSPRLIQILFLLINTEEHIPAATLAKHIQSSKRTVFRELSYIDRQLASYGLILDTKSKKGICIIGEEAGKKRLLDSLERSGIKVPQNREERCNQLIQVLLWQEEPNKLYAYAARFQVSDTTIGKDLERVEPWFQKNHITIIKKTGVGIYLEYEEPDYRKACMRYIFQNMDDPFSILCDLVDEDIPEKVSASIQMAGSAKLNNMAKISCTDLMIYFCIMIHRIRRDRSILSAVLLTKEDRRSSDFGLAIRLIEVLSQMFRLEISEPELTHLYIYLKGIKPQHMNDDISESSFYDLECLIFQMIHQYDQKIAFQLKHDEILIKGLLAHLRPTIVRMQYEIGIHNPFQEEVMSEYPEVYRKTENAVRVLEDTLGLEVPPEETGLLALHFGGAQVRLGNREKLMKKIAVGVICASGIGISTLMASRISQAFHGKVRVKSLTLGNIAKGIPNDIELLVSSFEIPDAAYEYLRVNPMLTEADISAISERIDSITKLLPASLEEAGKDIFSKIDEIELISKEIRSILKSLDIYRVHSSISFQDMVRLASETADETDGSSNVIYDDLMKREALSTQVIPEFRFTLLHAKTTGVSNSKFFIICPETGVFSEPHFMESAVVVVMLIPNDDPREMLAISVISHALFEDDTFFDDIRAGRKEPVKKYTEKLLRTYLQDKVNEVDN